jgi:HEAT repeat protein
VEALEDRLRDRTEEWITRRLAADALGEIRSYRAIEILKECLLDRSEEPSIREYVAMVLARTKSELARLALRQCCSEESSAVGKVAEAALQAFDNTLSSVKDENWSVQHLPFEDQIKEGVIFKQ